MAARLAYLSEITQAHFFCDYLSRAVLASSTDLFDPVLQTFSASGSLNTARSNQTATLLTDGTVLIAGGYESTGGVDPTLASSEIYQPTSLAPANLVSIALSPSAPSVSAGAAQRFTATGTFSDNSTEVLSATIWSSSNNTIATVTNDWTNEGAVFGVAPGSATLSACTGTICGSTNLTVSAAQLSITGLSPVAGDIGSQVIVSGTGFGATQGSSTVTFNGTAAVVSLWSTTAIIATVPAGATSGDIVVAVRGTNSNGAPFTITSGPVITGVSPSEGFAGEAVTISGTNFGATQGSSAVSFNGLPAVVNSWSNNSIGVTVPDGATTGNVVATVSGLASNAVPFTVATIVAIAPSSGPVGMLVTIEGSGFGATQGSGIASINGTPMQVVSWSDNVILAAVGSGTNSGAVTVQQGSVSIPGPFFTIDAGLPYNVSPQTLSLSVGQSQTLSAPTGLQWITTNPNVVTLSKDDPPALTGVAAGSATVYAGAVPISITVYAGSFPTGTILWSVPTTTSSPIITPAVPSNTGVDVFVLDDQNILALTADGTLAWQTATDATKVIPDFTGNAFTYGDRACPTNPGYSHAVSHLDPTSHQENLFYTFSCNYVDPLYTFDGGIGSVYTDRLGTETVIPDTLGNVFIQDVDKVVLFNSSGQQVVSIPLEISNIYCPSWVVFESTPACSQGQVLSEPPAAGHMIVAGDGNAYVPYVYFNDQTQTGGMIVLRVSPDGSYSKIPINPYPYYVADQVADYIGRDPNFGPSSPSSLSVITNSDQGVAVVYPQVGSNQYYGQLTYISGDTITGQTALPSSFWPQLQRADGTYIGTIGDTCPGGAGVPGACGPVNNENGNTVVAVGPSGFVWQRQFTSLVLPLYATSDGGVTVTSTQVAYNQQQLGTLYSLDSGGNILSESADSGAMQSWTGSWYVDPPNTVSAVQQAPTSLAPTFSAFIGGNASGNSTAIDQVQTNSSQGSGHQLPSTDAILYRNYNSIELLTTATPGQIFSQEIETFAGAQPQVNDVAAVTAGAPVTASGQTVTFTMQGIVGSQPLVWLGIGQGPFKVQVERFDTTSNTLSVVTLDGHPLAGGRYWRTYSVGINDVVVETGAIDTPGPGAKNYAGFWGSCPAFS